jgi:hypothetical protein
VPLLPQRSSRRVKLQFEGAPVERAPPHDAIGHGNQEIASLNPTFQADLAGLAQGSIGPSQMTIGIEASGRLGMCFRGADELAVRVAELCGNARPGR